MATHLWACQLSMYCLSAPNSAFFSMLWYWSSTCTHFFFVKMLSFISRECWGSLRRKGCSSWFLCALLGLFLWHATDSSMRGTGWCSPPASSNSTQRAASQKILLAPYRWLPPAYGISPNFSTNKWAKAVPSHWDLISAPYRRESSS